MCKPALPSETKILNTRDGRVGTILNGTAYDATTGQWTEYEVITDQGIERWQRADFILIAEIEETN